MEKSIRIGVATHSEEYVPIITPTNNANKNPLIDGPPKINMINTTTNKIGNGDNARVRVHTKDIFNRFITDEIEINEDNTNEFLAKMIGIDESVFEMKWWQDNFEHMKSIVDAGEVYYVRILHKGSQKVIPFL